MRRWALALLVVALASANAAADGGVGVLVTGDSSIAPVRAEVETWLQEHGLHVVRSALSPDAEKTLLNCFVLDDAACSRGVVESRAKADSIMSVRIATSPSKVREVLVIADWIVKGHNGVGMRRTCEDCTDVLLRQTVDAVMGELAKSSPAL